MSEIGLFEAIHTARALRRLKPDAVPEALITQILDAAIRAPSAGNAQNWSFVVVRDPEVRRGLGAVYAKPRRSPKRCMPRAVSPRTSPSANISL
jgi:nitroreductase